MTREFVKVKELKVGDKAVIYDELTDSFITEEIEEIEELGFEEVYDITVEGTENFIANNCVVSNTRWRFNDVIGYTERKIQNIVEKEGHYDREVVNLCFRAFYDTTDNFLYDFRQYQDQMLWGEVSSSAYINAKYSDDMTYHSVYQQRPLENLISIIKKDWIKMIPEQQIPASFEDIIISVDTSYNDKKTSDKAAYGVFGVTSHGEYYLLDLFYERCGFLEGLDKLDQLVQENIDYTAILIETKANGQAVYETLEKKYSRIIQIDATESKKARLLAVSPIIQSGKLCLPDNRMGQEVLAQLLHFTGEGKHEKDDLVDITTQMIRWHDEQFKYKFTSSDIISTKVTNGRNQNTSSLGIFKPDTSGQSLVSALKNKYNAVSSTHKNNQFSRICRL
jgi:predicted phage terminase large subunit-like protein